MHVTRVVGITCLHAVGPGSELFSKRPSALALANVSVQEKKREWQRLQKQKKQMQLDREKLKEKELHWNGRAGGLELSVTKSKKTALPPLDDAALERSASVPHMKVSEEQRPTSSGAEMTTSTDQLVAGGVKEAQAALDAALLDSAGGASPDKKKKFQSATAYSRRLKESPLAGPPSKPPL